MVLGVNLSVMEAAPERQRRGEDRQYGDHTNPPTNSTLRLKHISDRHW